MNSHTLQMIKYWRKALIDGTSQKGRLTEKQFAEYKLVDSLQDGRLDDQSLDQWQKVLGDDKNCSGLFVAPLVYTKGMSHSKKWGGDQFGYLIPLYLSCTADRDGVITPQPGALPLIPRDILEPADNTAALTIATIDDYTDALAKCRNRFEQPKTFGDFRQLSLDMLHELVPELDSILESAGYQKNATSSSAVLFEDNKDFFIQNILTLYDCAIRDLSSDTPPAVPLLDNLCSGKAKGKTIPALKDSFTLRLGYANNQHSLAEKQRLAAACLLEVENGEALAVNGPPGTGKTSMLLSLIATEFSAAALRKDPYPPLIVAASTNNQAVTNILADFGKIPSEEGIFKRWLPQLSSFGCYFPASNKKEQSVKDGYITEAFFDAAKSTQYLESAQKEFLADGAEAAGRALSLNELLEWLHKEIREEHQKLVECHELHEIFAGLKDELEGEDKNVFMVGAKKTTEQLDRFVYEWREMWRDRTLMEKYLSWLPWVGKRLALKKSNVFERFYPSYRNQKLFGLTLDTMPEEAEARLIKLEKLDRADTDFRDAARRHGAAEVAERSDFTLLELDEAFDAKIRRRIFWLSVHYWEGRWIQESEKNKERRGQWWLKPEEVARNWRMRMMLTPCAVATFFRVPAIFKIKDGDVTKPLYGIIDLLIGEESGQVSPETAAISFALAKRAVVVGDTLQIEPVWSVPEAIDRSNAGIEELNSDTLAEKGQLASSGSIMRMAQSASVFSDEIATGLERGLYLVEHRRCLKEIIRYCNDLCYKGVLIPKNSGKPSTIIPPMCGLHVQGSAVSMSGSRANEKEAARIAQWLTENKTMLQKAYGKDSLETVVGIVTPFRAQANLIRSMLGKNGIQDAITIGTVHSLQGAERPVVVFSPVYTNDDRGKPLFFNRSPNMLNVAVSRAKENFIVIGDMRLIASVDSDSPYGRFFNHLVFIEESRETIAAYDFPLEIRPNCWLAGESHDDFFHKILSAAQKRIVVTSPWVTQKAVEVFHDAIAACLDRGVHLHIITDMSKNVGEKHKEGLKALDELGVMIHKTSNVHAKQLFCDGIICVDGSLNWLSASRQERFKQVERSFAQTTSEARTVLESLCRECGLDISTFT